MDAGLFEGCFGRVRTPACLRTDTLTAELMMNTDDETRCKQLFSFVNFFEEKTTGVYLDV